jgi:hypothetical protein
MFLWVGGSQTAAAYSIVGRTKVVHARSIADWVQVPMFLLKKAKVLFAFQSMLTNRTTALDVCFDIVGSPLIGQLKI